MKKSSIFFISIIGLFVLMVSLPKNPSSQKEILFVIEKGEGSKDISSNLEKEGMIWWNHLFRAYVLVRGTSNRMQAGIYKVSPSMSTFLIAERFASGDIAKEMVTIPEGFTAEQVYERIKNLVQPVPDNLEELKKHEGYLFPDTYQIPYNSEVAQVIKITKDNFEEKTAGLKITPQIVVMASILEKELLVQEDKEIASGILWKRLGIGMPLQVDADLWTYQNRGLPEKPIANPGLESILAALYPKETPYWYYLSAPSGQTIFSRTLEEHNIARVKYLK